MTPTERFALKIFLKKIKKYISVYNALIIAPAFIVMILALFSVKITNDKSVAAITPTNVEIDKQGENYTFLIMGKDNAADLCDAIIIVSYDTKAQEINLLQLPRDTYASYTSASYRKLNGAVHSLGGVDKFVDFLKENLQIEIDYYVSVDLGTIAQSIDKLGGVEVNIPEDLYYNDPYQNLSINLKKGTHILNGEQATQFLRYRSGYLRGDLGRLDAQKIFLASAMKKIICDSDIFSLSSLALWIIDNVETNISAEECLKLLSNLKGSSGYDIGFMTMPGEDIQTQSGAWYYIINREEAYNLIKKYFSPKLEKKDFDKNKIFTSKYQQSFNRIYEAEGAYKTERYTAEEIYRDGINID